MNFELIYTPDDINPTDAGDAVGGTLVHPYLVLPDVTVREVMDPKRMAVSSRRTLALQKSGILEIRNKVDTKSMQEPVLYGYSNHYNKICCWGANDKKKHCVDLGYVTLTSDAPIHLDREEAAEKTVLLSDVFVQKSTIPRIINRDLSFDFKPYRLQSRTTDLHLWPKPNTKAISSKKTLAEMMTLGYVVQELARKGIIPVVSSPNQARKDMLVKVPFGPMLDDKFQPAVCGQRLKASLVYNQFRLKKSTDYNDPWLANIWLANAIVLRIPEKNGLPFDLPIQEGMSPIGELLRIDEGKERLGFYFYGSGGNPVISGFVSPDAKARKTATMTAVEGATFESTQTITNKMNSVMEQICESSRPVAVFLAGSVLPKSCYDPNLQKRIGKDVEQSSYLGVYHVRLSEQEEPMEPSSLLQTMLHYKEYYPQMKG
ncbi:hypothetical protein, partial [uncultured Marinobacter sp.]|uniref:hypothetical protein n=1 Tax=uncultured Marinobacter sp. TaxID=187379 RepID=UPI002592695D